MILKMIHTERYYTLQNIGYRNSCNEFTETRCRTVYGTSSEERCWKVDRKECNMVYATLEELEYQQEYSTLYEKECQENYGEIRRNA